MSNKNAKKQVKRRGAANGYKLPDPIPKGEILTDMAKNRWLIGSSIGTGGFGEIYSAASYVGKAPKTYPTVIKIEPHGNGPLFVEMHFYVRNAKSDDIETWKRKHKLSSFGMPRYIGSGSHECNGTKYRFVVMDRYGTDLWKLFLENGRRFPEHTVYKIALQIIDVLEYIHDKTYVHADIKGANLLLDLKCQQAYLVDFGLASRCTSKPEYKLDPKKAHNGTIEYTSRDAHVGVPTMRGDFEILGYNIIQWACGSLPWETNLKDPVTVQKRKEKAFEDIPRFLKECFSESIPNPIRDYFTLLADMRFNETPNYKKFKDILLRGLKDLGHKPGGTLEFNNIASSTSLRRNCIPAEITDDVKGVGEQSRKTRQQTNSLDESHEELVVNKRREGATVIRKILEDIDAKDDSDVEYDIRITKRRRPKIRTNDGQEDVTKQKKKLGGRVRKMKTRNNDRDTESEPEVRPMGTKSRPRVGTGKTTSRLVDDDDGASIERKKNWLKRKSDTDEDMFADEEEEEPTTSSPKAVKTKDFTARKTNDKLSDVSPRVKRCSERDVAHSRKRK